MHVLVPLKRVPDYQAKVKLRPDGSDIESEGIKWIVNPFDEIAVEEALRLQEKGIVKEITVVTIGPSDASAQLRYAMAMGADKGILVKHEGPADSDLASQLLAAVYAKGDYQMIIMGKQSIDSDAGQTAQLLAARLDLPQACFASKVQIEGQSATVTREVDGGLETIKIPLPCVVSTDLRLNEPRYASLPGIMKAKKKPLDEIEASSLGVNLEPKIKIKKLSTPPARKAGRKVASVDELVGALKNEAGVI